MPEFAGEHLNAAGDGLGS